MINVTCSCRRAVNLLLWTVLLVLPCVSLSAQDAAEITDRAAAVYENGKGVSVAFALQVRAGVQQAAESFEGVIQMKGDKFMLVIPGTRVWYDGKTQWTYMERNGEVNLTEPTGEELQYTNPALLLRMYKKGYTASLKGESTAANGKTAYDVELTPKKKGDIVKVSLQIEKYSFLPARISVESKNGGLTTVQIKSFTAGLNQPDSFFVFDGKQFPDAEVIDLR
ncbi:Outer membrane lipoprotein-sorting protein [Bacteroidales bacterium Barb6]|nr:Outer membrane lipoprotein-sorting protein [Bacteroidales bacterium Barb6]